VGHATDAIDLLRKSRAENPRAYYVHFCLAGALGLNGELVDAKSAIAKGITLSPGIDSIASWREYAIWDNSSGFLALAESTLTARAPMKLHHHPVLSVFDLLRRPRGEKRQAVLELVQQQPEGLSRGEPGAAASC
jgi:hypothetical protein